MNSKGRVVVGLSGGVDSSVAAYLLKKEGYEVIAMFMKNWHDDSVTISEECPWLEDSNDALLVAEKLEIPFQTIDLSGEYKRRIVDYMFREYENGRTPNPDILCNREIKFDLFLKAAINLGADYVATGHYCQKATQTVRGKPRYRLLSGADKNKDQSYFLCQISQEQLARALFPIGHLQKQEVRKIAGELGLVTAEKKDSQGLCFIGKVRLPDFLQQQLTPMEGDVIEISSKLPSYSQRRMMLSPAGHHNDHSQDYSLREMAAPFDYSPSDGKVVGKHKGAHYFTIGQRKGLHIGGTAQPLFVIGTDTQLNIIYVGQGEDHPGLYRPGLFVESADVHWVRPDLKTPPGSSLRVKARIRYRQALQEAELFVEPSGLYVTFVQPQRGVTPGQFVAWYDENDEELLGSGVISR